jgi:Protein kinase domain
LSFTNSYLDERIRGRAIDLRQFVGPRHEEIAVALGITDCLDLELRHRVEALLRGYDQPASLLDEPIVGPESDGNVPLTRPDDNSPGGVGAESPVGASNVANLTVGLMPDADYSRGVDTFLEKSARAVPAISGYEILAELGRGGMGVVYRARQVLLNRPCALKMILAGAHADDHAAYRFLAEAAAVARLQHPNIVRIHHIGEADGLPYFELEARLLPVAADAGGGGTNRRQRRRRHRTPRGRRWRARG